MTQIKDKFQRWRGSPIGVIIREVNPLIRGTGNYWSNVVAKKTFGDIDDYVYLKMRKHIRQIHPCKSLRWKTNKYFKLDYTGISKQKIATDPHSHKNQLIKMSWIPIERHIMIKYKNSPDDATLKDYYAKRDEKEFVRFNILTKRKIAKNTEYKCRVCNQSLVGEEEIHCNKVIPKVLGGLDIYVNMEFLHKNCYEQHQFMMDRYGEGKDLPRIHKYFMEKILTLQVKKELY